MKNRNGSRALREFQKLIEQLERTPGLDPRQVKAYRRLLRAWKRARKRGDPQLRRAVDEFAASFLNANFHEVDPRK